MLASAQTTLPGAALQGRPVSCFKSQLNSHFAQEACGQLYRPGSHLCPNGTHTFHFILASCLLSSKNFSHSRMLHLPSYGGALKAVCTQKVHATGNEWSFSPPTLQRRAQCLAQDMCWVNISKLPRKPNLLSAHSRPITPYVS